jgi:hypothetical protein
MLILQCHFYFLLAEDWSYFEKQSATIITGNLE